MAVSGQRLFRWKSTTTWGLHTLLAGLFVALFSNLARGGEDKPPEPSAGVKAERVYLLESVELVGTTRISIERLVSQLGLEAGVPLDDQFLITTRARLLSLGLFRSAILVMRKGSEKGKVHLVFEVKDDEGVLGPWALGSSLAVTQPQALASSSGSESPPLGYKMALVGRNFFSALHRGAVSLDIDGRGAARQGSVAYGIPRFAAEGVQFDADISFVDVNQRYLNTLGFGGRGQGLMTRTIDNWGDLQYGAAMYVNTAKRFRMPGYPSSIAGPKIGLSHETRLMSFVPGAGYNLAASVLIAPIQLSHSVIETSLARTFSLGFSRLTIGADAITVGRDGYGARGETRLDLPFSLFGSKNDAINLFSRFRGGLDIIENTRLFGSAAIFGIRYHSSGFIAEFAVQITKVPDALKPLTFDPATAEGP